LADMNTFARTELCGRFSTMTRAAWRQNTVIGFATLLRDRTIWNTLLPTSARTFTLLHAPHRPPTHLTRTPHRTTRWDESPDGHPAPLPFPLLRYLYVFCLRRAIDLCLFRHGDMFICKHLSLGYILPEQAFRGTTLKACGWDAMTYPFGCFLSGRPAAASSTTPSAFCFVRTNMHRQAASRGPLWTCAARRRDHTYALPAATPSSPTPRQRCLPTLPCVRAQGWRTGSHCLDERKVPLIVLTILVTCSRSARIYPILHHTRTTPTRIAAHQHHGRACTYTGHYRSAPLPHIYYLPAHAGHAVNASHAHYIPARGDTLFSRVGRAFPFARGALGSMTPTYPHRARHHGPAHTHAGAGAHLLVPG